MIILTATTDKIQVVLGGLVTANQLECVASWRDVTTTTFTPGRTVVPTNNTTDVDIVGSPQSSTQRIVDHVSVYNKDTASATVTVKFDANGTDYILFKALVTTGEQIIYTNEGGWKVLTNVGSIKTSVNQGSAPTTSGKSITIISGDVTNNNAVANTIADVTGLSFAVTSGKTYWFRFSITYTAAATATGSRWSINGPAKSYLAYSSSYSLTTTTWTINNLVAYDLPAASNATSPYTTGNTAIIEGFIKPSANGTVIARFASEIANSAIVAQAGSLVEYQEVLAA